MSKKHFIKVAEIIRKRIAVEETISPQSAGGVRLVAHDLVKYFAEENPRFDRARFLEACNVNH